MLPEFFTPPSQSVSSDSDCIVGLGVGIVEGDSVGNVVGIEVGLELGAGDGLGEVEGDPDGRAADVGTSAVGSGVEDADGVDGVSCSLLYTNAPLNIRFE
mmetsp:Transcript_27280/g.60604  ORF Transcript_27280/g.60604 Transcript_27280/m.60604 type:complete len:100 (-) Transcript_27280:478-777(-)